MTEIKSIIDALMCFGWITTYTLVFIGSIKYNYPLISLSAQLAIASLELSATIMFIKNNFIFNYAYFAYIYWASLEILIMILALKQRGFVKKKRKIYWLVLTSLTIVMSFLVNTQNGMIYFTYINTIIGMILWLHYILDKNFPIKPFSLAVFIVKLIADVLGAYVYYDALNGFVLFLAFFLPSIDVIFIVVYFYRRFNKEKYDAFYDKYEKYLPKIILAQEDKITRRKKKTKRKNAKHKKRKA